MEHEPHATNVFVSTYNNYSSIKRVTREFHVVVVQQETAKKCTILSNRKRFPCLHSLT